MRGWLLLAAALLLAGALLWVPTARVPLYYDMLAYSAQSLSLATGHGNTVSVRGEDVPGIYPAGLPALGALAQVVLGPDLRHAQAAVFVCALATLAAVYALARRVAGSAAGLAALLLLLSCAAFRDTARLTLSQVPTALAVALAACLWVGARRPGALFVAGLVAGLSLLLRYANVCFPAALLAAELLAGARREAPRGRSLLALLGGLAVAAGVVLAHGALIYGSPLATGYPLWGFDAAGQFSLSHVFETASPKAPGAEGDWILVRALLGLGEVQSVAVVLLALAGTWALWRRRQSEAVAARLLLLGVLGVAAQALFLAGYAFRSETYLVPTLPLVAAIAGVGAAWVVTERLGPQRAALAPLLAAAVLGAELLRDRPPDEALQPALDRHDSLAAADGVLEPDAVLLTTSDPALVEPLLGSAPGRTFVYLGPYVSPVVERAGLAELDAERCSPTSVERCAKRQVAAGRPVYLDQNPPPRGLAPVHPKLREALLEAFRFEPTPVPNIFRLVPKAAEGAPVTPPSGR
ncbi:MAG TPA: glycosyltransferase family 39 protein [Planctomycetota bacterium]|nr:glycosyltransferase family 39 protein [Planctomycetota bacterium]